MKRIILLSVLLFSINIIYCQNSLLIKDHTGTNVLNNDTVYVNGLASNFEIIEDFVVTNTNASSLSIKAKKNDIALVPGSQHAFCWAGSCYSTSTFISPYTFTMPSGSSTSGADNLSSHYRPYGNTGTSTLSLTVFDTNNPTDSAMVTVIFDAITDIVDIDSEFHINAPYPNPSNKNTRFNYNLNGAEAYISLYNIVGNEVAQYKLHGTNFILNTEKLHSGIYFYTLTVNGVKHDTKRLIIAH